MTKNQEDTSYESDNEGWVLIRKVSRAIWRHYEPDYGWEPAQAIGSWDR